MELKIETLAQKYHYHQGLVVWPIISTTYQVDTGRLQSQDLHRLHTKFQANMVRLCLKEGKKKKEEEEEGRMWLSDRVLAQHVCDPRFNNHQ